MKYTFIIILISSIISSLTTVAAYNAFNKNTKISVLGLDSRATSALEKAKSEYFIAMKYNYTNMTEKSAKILMNKKDLLDNMSKKASEAIADKAIQMIQNNEADIVIPDDNVLYSVESVKTFIH